MRNMKKINYKLVNLTLIIISIFFLYRTGNLWTGVINKILNILIPFIFAFAVAYALYPFLEKMQRKHIPKWLGVLIIVFSIILLASFVIYVVSSILVGQLTNLFNSILEFIKNISNNNLDINIVGLESDLNDIFKNILTNIGNYVSNGAINIINTSLGFISRILIGFAAFIYFIIDMDKIRAFTKTFFQRRSEKNYNYIVALDDQMRKYLNGLVKVMIISIIEYSIAYTIIGHPDALLLGFLAGVANLIPYFGGMANNCIAAITAFVISPSLFVKTIIVFVVLSLVDSYVINANVYGKTNSIHPLIVILSVFAGSSLFGVMGIVISFPLAIFIVTTYKFYKDDIMQNIKKRKKISS